MGTERSDVKRRLLEFRVVPCGGSGLTLTEPPDGYVEIEDCWLATDAAATIR